MCVCARACVGRSNDAAILRPGKRGKRIWGRGVPCHRQWYWYFVRRVNYMAHSTCQTIRFSHANFSPNSPKISNEKPATTSSSLFKGVDDAAAGYPKGRVCKRQTTLNFNQFQMTSCHTCVDYVEGRHMRHETRDPDPGPGSRSYRNCRIASLVQIASSSDRRNQVDARRVFWLMLDGCKSPNESQILLLLRLPSAHAVWLENPFPSIPIRTLHPRSYFVIFHRDSPAFPFDALIYGSKKKVWNGKGVSSPPDSCDLFIRVKLFQFHSVIRLDKGGNDKVVTGLTSAVPKWNNKLKFSHFKIGCVKVGI